MGQAMRGGDQQPEGGDMRLSMNGGYPKMDQNGWFIVENPSINR